MIYKIAELPKIELGKTFYDWNEIFANRKKENGKVFGLFVDGVLTCLLYIKFKQARIQVSRIESLHEGKGYGTFLLDFCKLIAKQYGYHKLTLYARENRIKWYQSQGFKPTKKTLVVEEDGKKLKLLFMERKI